MRIGIGYDIHQFKKKRKLILGGQEIPFSKGLAGHSDGDVLLHAISDALLGALGVRDIGFYFPDTNPEYKDISSVIILEKIKKMVEEKKYKILNIDSTIICQFPSISPYVLLIKENISRILGISPEQISIKAKTNEKIGEIGKGKGISVFAVVLIENV